VAGGLTPDSVCEKSAAPTRRRRIAPRADHALGDGAASSRVRACLSTRGTTVRVFASKSRCLDSVVADRTTPRRRRIPPRPPPRPRPPRWSNGDARAFALTRAKAHTPVLTRSMRVHTHSRPHLFPAARRPRRREARTRVPRVRCFVC
jgi:hypothetical protein